MHKTLVYPACVVLLQFYTLPSAVAGHCFTVTNPHQRHFPTTCLPNERAHSWPTHCCIPCSEFFAIVLYAVALSKEENHYLLLLCKLNMQMTSWAEIMRCSTVV
jgi:hypothetical protein